MEQNNEEFSGVFMFTNPTDKDRKYLWNNKEYTFPAESTVPLIIPTETLENIQEIRKRFAYRMAEERFYESDTYKKMKDQGNGIPPTFDPKILEPMIQECLKPLPIKRSNVKEGAKIDDERKYKATKAMGKNDNPSALFAEENQNILTLGEMSNN
jgi:hypothetical protein